MQLQQHPTYLLSTQTREALPGPKASHPSLGRSTWHCLLLQVRPAGQAWMEASGSFGLSNLGGLKKLHFVQAGQEQRNQGWNSILGLQRAAGASQGQSPPEAGKPEQSGEETGGDPASLGGPSHFSENTAATPPEEGGERGAETWWKKAAQRWSGEVAARLTQVAMSLLGLHARPAGTRSCSRRQARLPRSLTTSDNRMVPREPCIAHTHHRPEHQSRLQQTPPQAGSVEKGRLLEVTNWNAECRASLEPLCRP